MGYDHLLPSGFRSAPNGLQQFPSGAPILTTTIGFRDRLAGSDSVAASGQIAVNLPAIFGQDIYVVRISCMIHGGDLTPEGWRNWSDLHITRGNNPECVVIRGLTDQSDLEFPNPYSGHIVVEFIHLPYPELATDRDFDLAVDFI